MPDMDKVERYKKDYAHMSDAELINQMHAWLPHSDMHLAAKLLLHERQSASAQSKEKLETRRFHWFFWPALLAAVASIASLIIQIIQAK